MQNLVYLIFFILFWIVFLINSFIVVESWSVWVKYFFWKINYEELNPWIHLILPFITNVNKVNVRVKTINYKEISSSETFDSIDNLLEWISNKTQISVLDKRWLPISIELTILYQLKSSEASETIEKYWYSWDEKLVNPSVREAVRDILWEYEAEVIPEKRQEIAQKIKNWMIEKFNSLPVWLSDIQLRNISLPDQVKDKILQVQIAKQEVSRQQYELEKAKVEAETIRVKAEAEANAKIETAKWNAESIKLEAQAQSEANQKLSSSITQNLINYKYIEKWDWILPKLNWSNWFIFQLPSDVLNK